MDENSIENGGCENSDGVVEIVGTSEHWHKHEEANGICHECSGGGILQGERDNIECPECFGTGRDLTFMKPEELKTLPVAHQDMYAMVNVVTPGIWIQRQFAVSGPKDRVAVTAQRKGWEDAAFIAFAKNHAKYFVRHAYLRMKYSVAVAEMSSSMVNGLMAMEEARDKLSLHLIETGLLNQWRDRMMNKVAELEKAR